MAASTDLEGGTMNFFVLRFFVVVLVMFLAACASSSQVMTGDATIPVTVSTPVIKGEAAPYADDFYKALQDRGFKLGETDDPNAAALVVNFDPNVFHTEFILQLVQHGRVIVESKASNSGWGTGIARPQALARLADETTKNFRKELNNLSLKIVPDTQLSAQWCTDKYMLQALDPIRGKVILNDFAQPSFAQLTDQNLANDEEVKVIGLWANLQKSCFDSTVSTLQGKPNTAERIDLELAKFNELQALLAALATKKVTYGEFATKRLELDAKYTLLRGNRAMTLQDRSDKEKDRGLAITNQTQQSYQGQMQSVPRPTFTNCNRIGTQIFCRSY